MYHQRHLLQSSVWMAHQRVTGHISTPLWKISFCLKINNCVVKTLCCILSAVHSMTWSWDRCYLYKTIVGVNKVVNIKSLLLPSELWLFFPPTKYQSNCMCVLYSHRSTYLSYQVYMSVCPNVFLCIALNFTSILVGGDIKEMLHNSSTKPCASPWFTWYTRVYYITIARRY